MQEQTGETYTSAKYSKALWASESKVGKSTFLVASALGLMPWQRSGGVVDRPDHLHVVTFDSSALSGIKDFLLKHCNANPEALKFRVYNFQDQARRVAENPDDYNHSLFMDLVQCRDTIAAKCKSGVHVVLMSSLTGLAAALERSLMGAPTGASNSGKGYGSQDKWQLFKSQMFETQNLWQVDDWHCWWEGHLYKPAPTGQDQAPKPESIAVSGKAGQTWGYNVEQIFRLRREMGNKYKPKDGLATQVDLVYADTVPDFDFVANGRGFTGNLSHKEYDATTIMRKLGLKVGGWGAPAAPPKPMTKK